MVFLSNASQLDVDGYILWQEIAVKTYEKSLILLCFKKSNYQPKDVFLDTSLLYSKGGKLSKDKELCGLIQGADPILVCRKGKITWIQVFWFRTLIHFNFTQF